MFNFFNRYPEQEIHLNLRDREEDVLDDLSLMLKAKVISSEDFGLLHKMVGQTFERYHTYATLGKDRKKLGFEIGERAETRAREMIEYYKHLVK